MLTFETSSETYGKNEGIRGVLWAKRDEERGKKDNKLQTITQVS